MGLFQKPPTRFFFLFYILIFNYFFRYETIARSSAWSFGHSDPDPSSVIWSLLLTYDYLLQDKLGFSSFIAVMLLSISLFFLSGCVLSYYVTLSSTVPVLKRGSVIDYLSLPPWALHSTMFRTCHDSYFLNVHKPLFIFNEGNYNYVMLLFSILWCINTIHLQFSILLTGSWDYPETMNFSQK